jgi:putative membrane protein
LHKHIAWINILRLQLRRDIPWATSKENIHQRAVGDQKELEAFDAGLLAILEANGKAQYFDEMRSRGNPANFLMKSQAEQLTLLKRKGQIDGFEHQQLMQIIGQFLDQQGGCERIKTTPLFRQYSTFSRYFVKIFIFLLPFGLLRDLQALASWGVWLVIPFSLLISWVFYTMEQIGEYSENPFDNAINDIPMSTICRNIEADIRELLHEKDIPPRLQPVNNILL